MRSRSSAQHLARAVRVEVAGGLVGEDELRPVHEGAGNGHALQLAAGELPRHALGALGETDRAEHGRHSPRALCRIAAEQGQWQADILRHAQVGQNVEALENKTEAVPAQARERVVAERGELHAAERDRAAVGDVEPGDEVEQRRLADPRLAHYRDVVARRELELDAAEHRARARPAVRLGQTANDQHGDLQRPAMGARLRTACPSCI